MGLKIVTDSAADLPDEIQKKFEIHVIPTPVIIDGADYFDGETILAKDFYEILRQGNQEISTYHINAFMFEQHLKPYAQNKDQVIYICFSTGLAGTYNAANLAKEQLLEEFPDFDLTIVDSKCASLGFGLLVYYALVMQINGADKEEILNGLNYHSEHMEHIFTVYDLEYLFKGGRISRTSMVIGGMLDIHPIIEVNEAGALSVYEKIRGRKKSLSRCVEIAAQRNPMLADTIVGICHGDDLESLIKVKEMLSEKYGCRHFLESYVGCAIGAHTGPGIIGIVFLDQPSPYLKTEHI